MDLGDEGKPDKFEPYLEKHPEDEARRMAAMVWYSRRHEDPKRLKYHTLLMIKYHPSNDHIYYENSSAFFAGPAYRSEVIGSLEKQLERSHSEQELYWILAMTCEQGAIPPVSTGDPATRTRFLRYYGLPQNTVLPTKIDHALADKAIGYYKEAITVANGDRFYAPFYSRQLADLFLELDKPEEAVKTCKSSINLADEISKPGLLVTYGQSLRKTSDLTGAKIVLRQVRGCDKEEDGPGCNTTDAETLLGLIALQEHDVSAANRFLLSSCNVHKCCHNTTKGFSLRLAEKLLDAGQYDSVTQFCTIVLRDFTPGQPETQRLLDRAKSMRAKAKQSSPTPP
ncbi:MAG TPA: hypothetical protein VFI02_02430 [Armatimonadota bacterium]|nr:hypothetical protein [Armatimonadota bacterium]